jgi:predicted GNAT family acetyltransferase
MRRAVFVSIGFCIVLASCTERMICPAYQSAYIYDKDELRKKFSYFLDDSTPKVYTASKNKYLIAEPVSYQRKVRSMQTVVMKPVYVNVPDSISGKGVADSVTMEELNRAAQSVIDSTFIVDRPKKDSVAAPLDSIYVITKDKELRLLKYNAPDSLDYDSTNQRFVRQKPKYYVADVRVNVDEENYLWYLRDEVVLPDVRLAQRQQEGDGDGEKRKEKKKAGFFRNLFKKKEKEVVDTTATETGVEEEEFDYVDETDSTSMAETPLPGQENVKPKKEKKGLFGRKKNKPAKKRDEPKKEEEQPAEKTEDEDDGF